MQWEQACSGGSGVVHNGCQCHMHESSMVARLWRLQQELDGLAGTRAGEQKAGESRSCKACARQCFTVSEAEFVQILDFLLNSGKREALTSAVLTAHARWQLLNAQQPSIARLISGRVLLRDILQLETVTLPFSCLFQREDHTCSIHEVRPIYCRLNGLPAPIRARYEEKRGSFWLLKTGSRTIIRRPVPLFYYFELIFKSEEPLDFDKVPELDLYRDLLFMSEEDYLRKLAGEGDPEPGMVTS